MRSGISEKRDVDLQKSWVLVGSCRSPRSPDGFFMIERIINRRREISGLGSEAYI